MFHGARASARVNKCGGRIEERTHRYTGDEHVSPYSILLIQSTRSANNPEEYMEMTAMRRYITTTKTRTFSKAGVAASEVQVK